MPDKPEAPASVSYAIVTSAGFPATLTVRSYATKDDVEALFNNIKDAEARMIVGGFQPDFKKKGFTKKPVEYVDGKVCPTCGEKLVYGKKKDGSKFIKCSTNVWNKEQKKYTGCPYVDWMDGSPPQTQTAGGEPLASQAQLGVIAKYAPEKMKEGLTKAEASAIIDASYKK